MKAINSSLPFIFVHVSLSIITFFDIQKNIYGQEKNSFYLTVGAGITDVNDIDVYETTDEDRYRMQFDLDQDKIFLLGVGYDFGRIRAETSLSKSVINIGSFNSTRDDGTQVMTNESGDFEILSLFLTGYYDFFDESKIQPYFGAGIGISNVDISNIKVLGINGSSSYENVGNNGDSEFSYELKLGSSYEFTNNSDLYFEGIYRKTSGIQIGGSTDLMRDIDVSSLSALGGIRFKF